MNYRLAILASTRAQLESTLLREWLKRAGFSVCSCWPGDLPSPWKAEDVAFVTSVEDLPLDTPLLTLGQQAAETAFGGSCPPVAKIRGSLLPRLGQGWFVAGLDPVGLGPAGGQDELRPLLGLDAQRALAAHRGPQVPNVTFLETPQLLSCEPPSDAIISVDIEGANGIPNIVGVAWEEEVAYVFPWSDAMRVWLCDLFASNPLVGHNMAYDLPELEAAGVPMPESWFDTINMAALYEPDLPKNLQFQTLTHVLGSITWKGLTDHQRGPDYEEGNVSRYRSLWRDVFDRLGRQAPTTGTGWYAFYNCLDVCYTLSLFNQLKRKLTGQGRYDYYLTVLQPLQRPLLEIGARGMPCDEARIAEHREECKAKVAAATAVLVAAGAAMLQQKQADIGAEIWALEGLREQERQAGERKFSRTKELSSLRTKLKATGEFNPDSPPQRAALLYDWYQLPPIKNKGAKGNTTDDTAVADLLNRLGRGTIKPKRETPERVAEVLQAMTDVKRWGTLERTFLRPELR